MLVMSGFREDTTGRHPDCGVTGPRRRAGDDNLRAVGSVSIGAWGWGGPRGKESSGRLRGSGPERLECMSRCAGRDVAVL
jgi:hypothetical protein